MLSRIVLIKPGEGRALVWSAAYFFFMLFAYYMLRPVRDTMGIRGDLNNLPWLWTCTTFATLLISPLFAWVVARLPRRRFVPWLYRIIALSLLAFWLLLRVRPGSLAVGYTFFVWVSVYNLLSTSVFWGFMADAYSQEQAKRLFGAIGVGGTLGAIVGATIPASWAPRIGPINLILISAVMLEVVAQCASRLCKEFRTRLDTPRTSHACPTCGYDLTGLPIAQGARVCPECGTRVPLVSAASREPSRDVWAGFVLVAKSGYLQMMVVYMLLFTITSTFLEFEQARLVKAHVSDETARTQLFSSINLGVNILALLTQLFLTGRILSFSGSRGIMLGLLVLPVLTFAAFGAVWARPTLAVIVAVQVARRGMHFAVDRPTREVLYTVLGPDAKYKSKSFIDTFVYRSGDLAGAWASAWCNHLALGMVSLVGLGVAAVWSVSGLWLSALQRRETRRVGQWPTSDSAIEQTSVQSLPAPAGRSVGTISSAPSARTPSPG